MLSQLAELPMDAPYPLTIYEIEDTETPKPDPVRSQALNASFGQVSYVVEIQEVLNQARPKQRRMSYGVFTKFKKAFLPAISSSVRGIQHLFKFFEIP